MSVIAEQTVAAIESRGRACKVCYHPDRRAIEKELAAGQPNLRVATKYGDISEANVRNHLKHYTIPATLRHETEIEFHNMLTRHAIRLEKMLSACDEWLTDPNDDAKYSLAPRGDDVKVIYDEFLGDNAVRRSALLSELMDEINGTGRSVIRIKTVSDKYRLFLDTVGKLHDKLDMLAKIRGLYTKEAENPANIENAIESFKVYQSANPFASESDQQAWIKDLAAGLRLDEGKLWREVQRVDAVQ